MRIDRLQQRPLDKEGLAVQLAVRARAIQFVRRFKNTQLEQLTGVVPLVQRMADIEPFVALQSNQVGAERRGRGSSQCRLADTGFAFEKQGAAQAECKEDRNGEAAIRDVVLAGELLLDVGNGLWVNPASISEEFCSGGDSSPAAPRPLGRSA